MAIQYQIQLPVFEGPMDLLLHLVEREELDITTIALAQVTDQYLAHLADIEQRQARDITNFLVVAARLLLIKSQALLPRPSIMTPEAEDVGEELVRQLQAYKRFKQIAKLLHERQKQGLHSYVRVASLPPLEPHLDMEGLTLDALLAAVQEALDAVPAPPVDEVIKAVTVTIDEQMSRIEKRLLRLAQVSFRDFLYEAQNKPEVIVTLLAVLELIKQKRVRVRQEEMFGEIFIEREEADADADDVPASAPTT